jgi:hypothetical protein
MAAIHFGTWPIHSSHSFWIDGGTMSFGRNIGPVPNWKNHVATVQDPDPTLFFFTPSFSRNKGREPSNTAQKTCKGVDRGGNVDREARGRRGDGQGHPQQTPRPHPHTLTPGATNNTITIPGARRRCFRAYVIHGSRDWGQRG